MKRSNSHANGQSLLGKALGGGLWGTIGALVSSLSSLLFAALSIRMLGRESAGVVQLMMTVSGISVVVGGFGMGTAALQLLSRSRSRSEWPQFWRVWSSVASLSWLVGGLVALAIALCAKSLLSWADFSGNQAEGEAFLKMAAVGFFFAQVGISFLPILQSCQHFRLSACLLSGGQLLMGVAGTTVLLWRPTLFSYGLVQIFVPTAMALLALYWATKASGMRPRFTPGLVVFRELWPFGKWVWGVQVLGVVFSLCDRLLIVGLFGAAALPLYAVPRRLYETVHAMLTQQLAFVYPLVSGARNVSATADAVEDRLLWFSGVVAGGAYLGIALFGGTVLETLVGGDFGRDSRFNLWVFSFVGLIHAFFIPLFVLAYAKGDSRTNFGFHLRAVVLVVPSMVFGGMFFGPAGATVGQLGIVIAVGWLLCSGSRGMRRMRVIGSPIVCWVAFLVIGVSSRRLSGGGVCCAALQMMLIATYPVLLLRTEALVNPQGGAAETAVRALRMIPTCDRLPSWVGKVVFGSKAWGGKPSV